MSTEENKAIIRRWFEEVINEKRLDRADELVAQDYVDHGALPGQAPGLTGAKQKWGMYITAVPDLHSWSEDMVAEGDEVAVRWTAEGTHQGELLGVSATGKEFRFTGLSICRLAEGKMAEQWEEWDKLDLMRQLGVMPSPVQGKP
jgi:predicted ester cyclase